MTSSNEKRSAAVKVITGVPRSGTSVLHALACTDPRANAYIGESSYLRAMVRAYQEGLHLFDAHTRYIFPAKDDFRRFHRDIVAKVIEAHFSALGGPDILVLKDPLMINVIGSLVQLVEGAQIILIIRHPAEVIASRLDVQDRRGVPRTLAKLVAEHNTMLKTVVRTWDQVRPDVVTYPMVADPELTELKAITGLEQMDSRVVWQGGRKKYPDDGQAAWMTPLYGGPVTVNTSGRQKLSAEELAEVESSCLAVCHQILGLAGLPVDDYWQPASERTRAN